MAKKPLAPLKFPPGPTLKPLYDRVIEIASQYPGVESSRSYGTPSIKVAGKVMARLRTEAEGGLALRCDVVEQETLMATDPEVFYITDHYKGSDMFLINLEKVDWVTMEALIESAWYLVAKPKLIKVFESRGD
ncbi:MAG: MmcQ/YjbR family DNA-binding protein [Pseudomonadota bacterium]